MSTVLVESTLSDDERRARLFAGDIFVYAPKPSTLAFVEFTRELVRDGFRGLDPETAQYDLEVEDYAALLAELKPRFIHHPRCKELIRDLLVEHGADPERTYFDVPRLRTSTSDDYLTSGIAYAFHPHRDTWYSAPMSQLNWWIPIYPIEPDNSLAFYPRYFNEPVKNNSEIYNYYEWNTKYRGSAAQHVKSDTREQPKPQQELESVTMRFLPPPGGLIVFSGSQLHETVPNKTNFARYSIDFRTVHYEDVIARRGASNLDSRCTGTVMRDYLRASDLTHLPEEAIALYDDETSKGDRLLQFGSQPLNDQDAGVDGRMASLPSRRKPEILKDLLANAEGRHKRPKILTSPRR
jgi:hypothetical protein